MKSRNRREDWRRRDWRNLSLFRLLVKQACRLELPQKLRTSTEDFLQWVLPTQAPRNMCMCCADNEFFVTCSCCKELLPAHLTITSSSRNLCANGLRTEKSASHSCLRTPLSCVVWFVSQRRKKICCNVATYSFHRRCWRQPSLA